MRSQVYFYKFDTLTKPGKIIAHGIRFESVELPSDNFDQTKFKLLCDAHPELRGIDFKVFRLVVQTNFR